MNICLYHNYIIETVTPRFTSPFFLFVNRSSTAQSGSLNWELWIHNISWAVARKVIGRQDGFRAVPLYVMTFLSPLFTFSSTLQSTPSVSFEEKNRELLTRAPKSQIKIYWTLKYISFSNICEKYMYKIFSTYNFCVLSLITVIPYALKT